jgi:hypothetical protein
MIGLLSGQANGFEHFASMEGNFSRTLDAEANRVAANFEDGDYNVVADHDGFVFPTRYDQHYECSRSG